MSSEAVSTQVQDSPKKGKKNMLWVWLAILGFILFEVWAAQYVQPSMARVTDHPHNLEEIFGWHIPFGGVNVGIVINTWLIMGLLVVLALFGRFGLKTFPGRRQGIFEVLVGAFSNLCVESLGERLGKKVVPYIMTLFFFIMGCNWLLIFYVIRWIEEPTLNLNTTFGLGSIAFFVSHGIAIKEKGFLHYLQHYFEPMIPIGSIKFPNLLFFPLHVIGEMGKVISHSFRLFGNILGGAIIYVVVTALIRHAVIPPLLHLFFGIFIGVIQAFVFSLLALTYISILAVSEEESL